MTNHINTLGGMLKQMEMAQNYLRENSQRLSRFMGRYVAVEYRGQRGGIYGSLVTGKFNGLVKPKTIEVIA